MSDFKNLFPYLETSLCADQKSYKNHDHPKEFDHVKQTRLRHVKNQMSNFKNLFPYLETSLCADQKSYKNHDHPKHLSRINALESYKKWAKTCLSKASLPFETSLKISNC